MEPTSDPDDKARELAYALRRAIRREGLSVAEAERRVGMGKDYLRQLLSGRVDLKVKHLLAVLHALNVEPRDFLADFFGPPSTVPLHSLFAARPTYPAALAGPAAGAAVTSRAVAFLAFRLRERGILTDEEAAGLLMEI